MAMKEYSTLPRVLELKSHYTQDTTWGWGSYPSTEEIAYSKPLRQGRSRLGKLVWCNNKKNFSYIMTGIFTADMFVDVEVDNFKLKSWLKNIGFK